MARQNFLTSSLPMSSRAKRGGSIVAIGAIALAGAALLANRRAAKAERDHPARGAFVTANGVRLHYVERGSGSPVVFLHGNGGMVDDMLISGIVDHTSGSHRAIVFDRPGFGHSARPRGQPWRAEEQAALLPAAFALLGIERPIVVGHSWGTLVALALALNHPEQVSRLILGVRILLPDGPSGFRAVDAGCKSGAGRSDLLHGGADPRGADGARHDQENVCAAGRDTEVRAGVPCRAHAPALADPRVLPGYCAHGFIGKGAIWPLPRAFLSSEHTGRRR